MQIIRNFCKISTVSYVSSAPSLIAPYWYLWERVGECTSGIGVDDEW